MSRYRNLLPSRNARGPSVASPSSPTWPILDQGESAASEAPADDDDANDYEEKPKKRRLTERPAQTACIRCRQNRSKCEGPENKTCLNCKKRGLRCLYETHPKTEQKALQLKFEQDRAQAKSLSQRTHMLYFLLQIILQDEARRQEFLQRLQRKEDLRLIGNWIKSLKEWHSATRHMYSVQIHTEDIVEDLVKTYDIESLEIVREGHSHESRWTRVTADLRFLDHLVKLYLKYVNSRCMLFSEIPFIQAYRSGNGEGCNSALLNAVCAMACNLLERDVVASETVTSIDDLQDAFLVEAKHSISGSGPQDLTTVQALAVIHLTESSSARARSANAYLTSASESLRNLELKSGIDPSPYFDLIRWRIHSLELFSCIFTQRTSLTPYTYNSSINFDTNAEFLERYVREAQSLLNEMPVEPEVAIKMSGLDARLCIVVKMIIQLYSGREGPITPQHVETCHARLVELCGRLPQTIQRTDDLQQEWLIFDLFRIKCYWMITNLWLPLVSLANAQRDTALSDVCCAVVLSYCRRAVKLLQGLVENDSCATLLPQHIFCALNLCDSLARWTNKDVERLAAIQICFKLLDSNSMNSKLCDILKRLFRTEIAGLIEDEDLVELTQEYQLYEPYRIEEALDATNRLTYVGSFTLVTELLDQDFQNQWPQIWREMIAEERSLSESSPLPGVNAMRLENICN